MANPFLDEERGPFLSFLDWLDRPGQAVRNLIRHDFGAAGRQFVDFLGEIPDALLPGDVIPNASNPEDYISGGELVGLEEPGIGKTAADIGIGILTDPLSFIPGKAVASGARAAAGVAKKGVQKLPLAAQDLVEKGGRKVRATFGAQKLTPETQQMVQGARAARANVARAGVGESERIFQGMTPQESEIVGDIIDNYRWENGKLAGELVPGSANALDRLAAHPGVTPDNLERIRTAVREIVGEGDFQGFSQRQAQEGLQRGIFRPGGEFRQNYLQRLFSGQDEEDLIGEALGKPSAVKGLRLDTFEKTKEYLDTTPGVKYERSAAKRLGTRAEQQGTLAQRAEIGKAILGKDFAYADNEMRSLVTNTLEEMTKTAPEDAQVLLDIFRGIPKRGVVTDFLAKTNRVIKPMMVYGAFIPKFGSVVRNKIGGLWQTFANPQARGQFGKQALRVPSDLLGGIDDGISKAFGFRLSGSDLTKSLDQIEAAFKGSGGVADNAVMGLRQAGRNDLADVVQSGVLEGFVSSEELLKEMGRHPFVKGFFNVMNWPGKIFKGVEDRMRLGMALDLMKSGKSADEAARITRDTFFDYGVSSQENRLARDLIPFFQFPAKSIPQSAKLIAEKPYVGVGIASALAQDPDEPIYPYLEGRVKVPLGADEQGNQQYAAGLGLPFESLNMIPGSFRDVKQDIVGSAHPLVKSGLAALFNEDPYFETPYGSYEKVPVIGEAGDVGRWYNMIAGTGALQPLDSPLRFIDKLLDERRDVPTRLIDSLTGANIVNVDPDLALQQQLRETLEQNPDVRQYRSFYTEGDDPETIALLKAYQEAKQRMKAKRQP